MIYSIFNYTKLGLWGIIYYLKYKIYDINDLLLLEIILNNIQNANSLGTKCIQKLIPYLYLTKYDNEIIELFKNTYENNVTHNLEYTKKIFKRDFNVNIEDNYYIEESISSGSIGQVYKVRDKITNKIYALKVKHPNIEFQLSLIKKIVNFFDIPKYCVIDINQFIKNFEIETNFLIEGENMKKFYDLYKENSYIIIPEVYNYTNDIIIMEYVEGVRVDTLSSYERNRYLTLFFIFCNNNKLINNFNHGDCHLGNFKKYDKDKIVIYDFGYCFSVEDKKIVKIIDDFWEIIQDSGGCKYDYSFKECVEYIMKYNLYQDDIENFEDDLEEYFYKPQREGKYFKCEDDLLINFIKLFTKRKLTFRMEYLNILLIYYHVSNYVDCDQRDLYAMCKYLDYFHEYQEHLKLRIQYNYNITESVDYDCLDELKKLI